MKHNEITHNDICSTSVTLILKAVKTKVHVSLKIKKCMYTRLYSFLEKHNLLFNKQFGFRSRYSTNHAIISLIELIKKISRKWRFC